MSTEIKDNDTTSLEGLSVEQIIEKFSDTELVPHGFIDLSIPNFNATDGQSLTNLHSRASRLLSELDHNSQDITWQMEALVGELMRLGNRLNYEVELLKNEVSGLAADIEDQATPKIDEIASIREKSTALPRLQTLDKVRSRMVDVKNVFNEAQNFDETRITNDTITALNAGNLDKAQAIIENASTTIQIWKGTSQFDSKSKFIVGLRKRADAIRQEIKAREDLYNPSAATSNGTPRDSPSPYAGMIPRSKSPENNDGYYGLINQLGRRIF